MQPILKPLLRLFSMMLLIVLYTFKVQAQCSAPTGISQTLTCGHTNAFFGANSPAPATTVTSHIWYAAATGGALSTIQPTVNQRAYPNGPWVSNFQGTMASNATVYIAAVCNGVESARTMVTLTFQADPGITLQTSSNPSTLCAGSAFTMTASGGTNFHWYKDGVNVYSGYTTIPPAGQSLTNGTYSLSGVTACGTNQSKQQVVDFKPLPVISANSQTICSGQQVYIPISNNGLAGTYYNWTATASNVSGSTAGSSDTGIFQTLTNTSTSNGSVTYTVTATAGNSCVSQPLNVVVTVKPAPTLLVSPTSKAICSTQPTAINLSNPNGLAGTVYNWTVSALNITGASASSGSVLNQFLTNNTNLNQTATYSITATAGNGCSSAQQNATVTVKPIPSISVSPPGQTICSGSPTSYSFSNPNGVSGTTYSWTVNAPGITGASAGSGSSLNQTLINTTNTNQVATYNVVASSASCGSSQTVFTTVKPMPTLSVSPTTQSICSQASTAIALSNPNNVSGTVISWAVSAPNITGASASNGNTIGQVLTNATNVNQTAVYTIVASANGCTSPSQTATITVKPIPTLSVFPPSNNICSGGTASYTMQNPNNVAGTVISWSVSAPNLTGTASGNGNFISHTLINNTTSSQTATYAISATANGCSSSQNVVTTVRPLPTISVSPTTQTICSGSSTAITLTNPNAIPGTLLAWTASSSGISGAIGGSGGTIAQVLTNNTNTTQTASYNASASLNGCSSSAPVIVITVKPKPDIIVTPSTLTICSGGNASLTITNPNAVIGTALSWTVNAPNISGAADGTGSSISQTLTTSASTVQTATYTAYATVNSCASSKVVPVIVNPKPTASASNQTIFSGSATAVPINSNGVSGTTFSWTAVASNVNGAQSGSGSTISQLLTLAALGNGSVTYTITPQTSSCTGSSVPVLISVYRCPVIIASTDYLAKGNTISLNTQSYDSYDWSNGATSQATSINMPGTYTITVTKDGAVCQSPGYPIMGQLDMNENYIITNTALIPNITIPAVVNDFPVDIVSQSIQYFDGLGRNKQTVVTQASVSKRDVVQPISYDAYGRENKKYLPYTDGVNGWYKEDALKDPETTAALEEDRYRSGRQYAFYQEGGVLAKDQYPYAETRFEKSPLSRPLEQGAPGLTWQPDVSDGYNSADRTVKFSYETDVAGGDVLLWTYIYPSVSYPLGLVSASNGATKIYYGPGQLFKTFTKDEQNNEVIEFKNTSGQVVLKRVQAPNGEWAQTYYVYDDLDNLVCVIPPEGVKGLLRNPSDYFNKTDDVKELFLKRWAFRYSYDSRKRMTQKQVPGASAVYMVYDKRDRVVLTQDGNQRTSKLWAFTKYDQLNRPVLTGIKDTTLTLAQDAMQAVVDAYYSKSWTQYGEAFIGHVPGNVFGYTNKSYPVVTKAAALALNSYLTATYYDTYDFKTIFPPDYDYKAESLTETIGTITYNQPANEFVDVIGQVTGSMVRVTDENIALGYTWLRSANYYDDNYRVIQTVSDNYAGGMDRLSSLYDFTGQLLKSKNTHYRFTAGSLVGVGIVGNTLKKTIATTAWDAGVASVEMLPANQDGWVEFIAPQINKGIMVGFSETNPDAAWASIKYALYLTNGGKLEIRESGSSNLLVPSPVYVKGDVLRVERKSGNINYYKNGQLLLSRPGNTNPLLVDMSFNSNPSSIHGIRSSFGAFSAKEITRSFEYDHAGRIVNVWHQITGGPEILLTHNAYNELGQLVDKKLHSTVSTASDAKQSVDYRYNIRGWLTSMNNAALAADAITNDEINDYFGFELGYDDGLGIASTGLYNGNIAAMKWSNGLGLGAIKQKAYGYSYDQMNRITAAAYKEKSTSWNTPAGNVFTESNYTYDLNGNILTLLRYNEQGSTSPMDNLTYSYGTGTAASNKLLKVVDAGSKKGFSDGVNTGNDYTYDANGNMITDLNKRITPAIVYNHLNLPVTVTRGSNTLNYIYDATGRKLGQIATFIYTSKQTDYNGEFVYENNSLQFINHEEGRVVFGNYKAIYQNDGSTLTDIGTQNGGVATLTTISGETYIKVTTTGTAMTGLFPIGGTLPVVPGERYTFRMKGYRNGNAIYIEAKTNLGSILFGGGNWAGAALPTTSDGEAWVEETITIPQCANQIQFGLTWGTGASTSDEAYVNEMEILKVSSDPTPAYQYNLKDHLGNVRLTFTTKQDVEVISATFESANQLSEFQEFENYPSGAQIDNLSANAQSGTNSQLLNGGYNGQVGVTKSYSVMPGDVVAIKAYAKYSTPSGSPSNLAGFATALLNAFSLPVPVPGETGTPSVGINDWGVLEAGGFADGTGNTDPKVFVTILVFDKKYNLLDIAYQQSNASGALMNASYTITEPGYAYIYVSNEHPTLLDVYFDDVEITHTLSPIVQMNDYYPFGLAFNSYERENATPNKYKFGGKEEQTELALNTVDWGWRQYDPAIGRWNVIDQWAEKYHNTSSYAFVQNNPILNREIDGRWFDEENEKKAAKIERKAEKRADKLEAKAVRMEARGVDSGDRRIRAATLRQSGQDVRDMRSNKTTEFRYAKASAQSNPAGAGNPTTERTGTNQITMFTEKNMGSKLHESRHGGQEARGELGNNYQNYGVQDEVSAYQAQYSWNGKMNYVPQTDFSNPANLVRLVGGVRAFQQTITNINQITPVLVNTFVDNPGLNQQLIYPPQGISSQQWNSN